MPHLIFSTKFPSHGESAEVVFFGACEGETLQSLQAATFAAMQSCGGDTPPAVGAWKACPFSSQVAQFVINIPSPWKGKGNLQSILRIAWLDVFERAGWGVVSSWNCREVWTPPGDADPALEAGAVALAGIGSPSGGAISKEHHQGECANYLLFKPLPAQAPLSASSTSETASTADNENDEDDDGDASDSSMRGQGLPLPEVVHRLLKEPAIIRWDSSQRCFEVLDGPKFERRFNQLRKVRQRHKNGATERPFSRMHNFFILKRGDKWAKTGTIFRPKKPQYAPPGASGTTSGGASAAASREVDMDEDPNNSMSMLSGACSVALALEAAAAAARSSGGTKTFGSEEGPEARP